MTPASCPFSMFVDTITSETLTVPEQNLHPKTYIIEIDITAGYSHILGPCSVELVDDTSFLLLKHTTIVSDTSADCEEVKGETPIITSYCIIIRGGSRKKGKGEGGGGGG